MRWFRRVPPVNTDPLDKATKQLEDARHRRRAALRKFVTAVYDTPIETDLAQLGNTLTSTDREAK
jgi:hypothetical protein